jgi:hypothetical protein
MRRIESRLAKLESKQAATGGITIVVVEDEDWYGNDAHRLAREAERTKNDQVGTVENERTP